MKFRNPKTGEIFEDIQLPFDIFCDEQEDCETCELCDTSPASDCLRLVIGNPKEAARLTGYEVIDDSKAVDFNPVNPDQTAKADAGKARLSLVPFEIVYDIARVREYGTIKYHDPDNWKQVEASRYVDALLRHALAFASDINSIDEESGLPHLWHAATNIAFLCEMLKGEYK